MGGALKRACRSEQVVSILRHAENSNAPMTQVEGRKQSTGEGTLSSGLRHESPTRTLRHFYPFSDCLP